VRLSSPVRALHPPKQGTPGRRHRARRRRRHREQICSSPNPRDVTLPYCLTYEPSPSVF
jgi:hypothetical protein